MKMKLFITASLLVFSAHAFAGRLGFMTQKGVTDIKDVSEIVNVQTGIAGEASDGLSVTLIDLIIKDKKNRVCLVPQKVLPGVDIVQLATTLIKENGLITCKVDSDTLPTAGQQFTAFNVWYQISK